MCRKRYTYTGTEDVVEISDRFILFYSFFLLLFWMQRKQTKKNRAHIRFVLVRHTSVVQRAQTALHLAR